MKKTSLDIIKMAFVTSLPVLAAYIFLGMGFGVLMSERDYPVYLSFFSSIFVFAGTGQYLLVDLLVSKASLLHTAFMTLMVNARHTFYGISMINRYKDMGKYKPYMIFGLTDETYSLLCDENTYPEKKYAGLYCFFVTAFDHLYWITGCTLGAVLGSLLDFNSKGIDFSMTAIFVSVFVDQWLKEKNHYAAIVGLLVTLICLIIFGSGKFLIPAMILITALLTIPYAQEAKKNG
ncbi:MAG: AzlC family ABC transporter permease [Lachnospiraceae bacterium]|nr:AzlC family ABC transporter permease [Lachnospiraceae bacterium]